MKYNVKICVIDPDSYKVTKYNCLLTPEGYTQQDFVIAFFRQWDKQDKYNKCYAIGIEQIQQI